MTYRPRAWVAWEGPSPLTGDPVGICITGPSNNTKTGPMFQAWALLRDVAPAEALKTGQDAAVCGDCAHRGGLDGEGRTCYVSMFGGPSAVWRAWQDGGYPRYGPADTAALLAGHQIRVTAYGDPVIAPLTFWAQVLAGASGWTGYTHQWRTCDPGFRAYLMASVDDRRSAVAARARGWRTFRARAVGSPLRPDEFVCPASDEAGHRTTCARCRLCRGTSSPAKSVAIVLHGRGSTHLSGRGSTTFMRHGALRQRLEAGDRVLVPCDAIARTRILRALSIYYYRRATHRAIHSNLAPGGFTFWMDRP